MKVKINVINMLKSISNGGGFYSRIGIYRVVLKENFRIL